MSMVNLQKLYIQRE